ncbi:l-3-05822 [Drosophila busckii]|uniref:L-3-05822 n=1 Tax=Drosophila busckii TaxID=30019 RepID=A0A0M4EMF5_DROBS|nr:l-3-05822 [Drosophila busckii]
MTIPSRPAPAPPGSRAQSAAAGANASLEQLRQQLQQQHLQQQQASNGGGLQKLTIKLPPPPKGQQQQRNRTNCSNNNFYDMESSTTAGSSITRKFPQARYTPATNWNDAPFAPINGNACNKKMPPPRPPPPKVNESKLTALRNASSSSCSGGGSGGGGIISNIFHRKKPTPTATTAATKAAAQSRVYGLSIGHAGAGTTTQSNSSSSNFNSNDWNAAWNTASTTTTTTLTCSQSEKTQDAQLISFDSPPSSPTFTQKSNSDCVSVDSFSSDSNFSSPHNGSVSQPESGFEDDYLARSRPATQSPRVDPWEVVDSSSIYSNTVDSFGAAPVRQMQQLSTRNSDNPLCNGKSLLPPAQSLTMPTIIKPKISQKPKAPKPPPFIGQSGQLSFAYGASTPPSPPMPKVAPPPLAAAGSISLLDVIAGKVDAMALSNGSTGYAEETEVPYAIALYNFDGAEEGDLTFRESEKIYLLEQPTEEWYRGRTRSGCVGLFPANYVEIKVPLGQQQQQQEPQQQHQQLLTGRCLYNFPGEVEGDLGLRVSFGLVSHSVKLDLILFVFPTQENEVVTLLYRINEDWLYGEVGGRQGQFPANFLEHVPDNLATL